MVRKDIILKESTPLRTRLNFFISFIFSVRRKNVPPCRSTSKKTHALNYVFFPEGCLVIEHTPQESVILRISSEPLAILFPDFPLRFFV